MSEARAVRASGVVLATVRALDPTASPCDAIVNAGGSAHAARPSKFVLRTSLGLAPRQRAFSGQKGCREKDDGESAEAPNRIGKVDFGYKPKPFPETLGVQNVDSSR